MIALKISGNRLFKYFFDSELNNHKPKSLKYQDVKNEIDKILFEFGFEDLPDFMTDITVVENVDILGESVEETSTFYIGYLIKTFSPDYSIKRMCLETRNLLEKIGLLKKDDHPDAIKIYEFIIKREIDELP